LNNWERLKADWRPLWLAIVKLVSRYILHTLPKQYTKSPFLNDLQSRHPSIFALFVTTSRTLVRAFFAPTCPAHTLFPIMTVEKRNYCATNCSQAISCLNIGSFWKLPKKSRDHAVGRNSLLVTRSRQLYLRKRELCLNCFSQSTQNLLLIRSWWMISRAHPKL
jgi:hypothetical protein